MADPTGRAILGRLASGEATIMELAKAFGMTQPAISQHLTALEEAGLIVRCQLELLSPAPSLFPGQSKLEGAEPG